VRVENGSPLATFTDRLVATYGWPESEAAWFLLTNEVPVLPPVSAFANETEDVGPLGATIAVRILAGADVSDESVVATVNVARRVLFERRRGPLSVGRRAMAEFVERMVAHEKKPLSWPERYRRWEAEAGLPREWRFPDWRAMRRAYAHERAARAAPGRQLPDA
jgi:hypothetical protein